ncbi:MAG TPA: hypothetical protein VE820_13770 [Sphingomicrobium sp.]|jgi:hypothetical protein|nr:hypothetical protein [Sphingomicrobium sp.]
MSDFDDAISDLNDACLDSFGKSIAYRGGQGLADPIATTCTLLPPRIDQSASPGYFADIEVDPTIITNPQRKDEVDWADGTVYVVSKVLNPPYGLVTLALHRKFDL